MIIKYPVDAVQEPDGEPDIDTMTVIRDASGRDLEPEEIAEALNCLSELPKIIRGSTWGTPQLRESAAVLVASIISHTTNV